MKKNKNFHRGLGVKCIFYFHLSKSLFSLASYVIFRAPGSSSFFPMLEFSVLFLGLVNHTAAALCNRRGRGSCSGGRRGHGRFCLGFLCITSTPLSPSLGHLGLHRGDVTPASAEGGVPASSTGHFVAHG